MRHANANSQRLFNSQIDVISNSISRKDNENTDSRWNWFGSNSDLGGTKIDTMRGGPTFLCPLALGDTHQIKIAQTVLLAGSRGLCVHLGQDLSHRHFWNVYWAGLRSFRWWTADNSARFSGGGGVFSPAIIWYIRYVSITVKQRMQISVLSFFSKKGRKHRKEQTKYKNLTEHLILKLIPRKNGSNRICLLSIPLYEGHISAL